MGQSQTKSIDEQKLRKIYDSEFESQIIAQNTSFMHKRAVELIERQELLGWEVLAAATTTIILLAAGTIYKRKDLIIPVAPLIMAVGYQYDVALGENRDSVRQEAEKLLTSKNLNYIGGPITLKDVDEYRKAHFST